MRSAGIAVELPSRGRPKAAVVIVDGAVHAPNLVDAFDLTTDSDELSNAIHDIAANLRNRLQGLRVDRVVIRRADIPPRANNREGPRTRLLVEGGLVIGARDVVDDVILAVGRDVAGRVGRSKAQLDEDGASLTGGERSGAAAAAISGLL